ncbi:MAG: hypothetical protein B7Y80_20630 [Hyphomicrobium sp. 32-62-53]|nr:MAG: hypothetical protein B7Z29_20505 [Hyphomicrobium sp. 12-62-95]OYX97191.1 MAG: hypothetical protein B7Y80_20630 [Hyphomicrobium sp. 32-62-53]
MVRRKKARKRRADKFFGWNLQESKCDIAARRDYVEAAKRELLRRAAEEAESFRLRRAIVQAPLRVASVELLPLSEAADQYLDQR